MEVSEKLYSLMVSRKKLTQGRANRLAVPAVK
jgi:hypothetical protein